MPSVPISRRGWIVLAVVVLVVGVAIWGIRAGYAPQIGRFFASEPGYVPSCAWHGEQLSPYAPQCCAGFVPVSVERPLRRLPAETVQVSGDVTTAATTSESVEGTDVEEQSAIRPPEPVEYCVMPGCTVESREVQCFRAPCNPVVEIVCPDGVIPPPRPTYTPVPTEEAGIPIDPTGACVWRSNFNAPEGAWFCEQLQCNLDGNNADAPTAQRLPPSGPASRLDVKVFRTIDEPIDASLGPIHVRTVLDATPKDGSLEGYPAEDPLWTCTAAEGVMYMGRDGSDFYDCYNPIIHRTNTGPITCCANTGLDGDCFTWEDGATPEPSNAPTYERVSLTIAPMSGAVDGPIIIPAGIETPIQLYVHNNDAGLALTAAELHIRTSPELRMTRFETSELTQILKAPELGRTSDGFNTLSVTVGSGTNAIGGLPVLGIIYVIPNRDVPQYLDMDLLGDTQITAAGYDNNVMGGFSPHRIVVSSGSAKPGDADDDGDVDIFDYNLVVSNFGGSGPAGDLDADGDVDIFDYNLVVSNFNK